MCLGRGGIGPEGHRLRLEIGVQRDAQKRVNGDTEVLRVLPCRCVQAVGETE
jgi:hypothetical protein